MEETEAQSPTAAVAGESGHLNPPQFASGHRRFRRRACSTHSNFPSSQACRHRTRTRTGCTCAGAGWCGTGTAPGRYFPGANGPLCAKCIEYVRISVVDWHKKPSRLEWHVHPPYTPYAGSCAPIDRLHSAYGSWVFVSTSLVQELICPCNGSNCARPVCRSYNTHRACAPPFRPHPCIRPHAADPAHAG